MSAHGLSRRLDRAVAAMPRRPWLLITRQDGTTLEVLGTANAFFRCCALIDGNGASLGRWLKPTQVAVDALRDCVAIQPGRENPNCEGVQLFYLLSALAKGPVDTNPQPITGGRTQ